MMMNEFAGTVRSQKRGSILFAAAVLLLVCVLAVGAVSAADIVTVSNFTELQNNISTSDDLTIIVADDVLISDTLIIGNGKNITLTTNNADRTLSRDNSFTGNLFSVESGGNLTIKGCGTSNLTLDGTGQASNSLVYVDGGNFTLMDGGILTNNTVPGSNGGGVYVNNSGTFTMFGGEISKNKASEGGGVYLNGSTLTMSGGTISGNTASSSGGGCYVNDGMFTMSGGTITNHTVHFGGGVFLNGGTLTMFSGEISGNNAEIYGGGVNMHSGTFTMSGGTITKNKASNGGGGVYGTDGSTFMMESGTISNNTAINGGGVFLDGKLTMSGGEITDNTATSGGGVYVNYDGEFEMSSGTITKNKASEGGGVYLNGKLTMSGGTISNNKANGDGGGVYGTDGSTFMMESGTISDNTASNGGGVYVIGIFELSGSSSVDSVYLTSDKVINVTADLTTTQVTDINLQSPAHGTTVVTISPAVSELNYLNYFQLNASLDRFELEYQTPNIVLKQQYCIVSFDAQGGTPATDEQSVQYGNTVSDPAPTWEGHTLEGWYTENTYQNKWNFSDPVTSDMTLYANWTLNTYTVSFDTQGGSTVPAQTVSHGGKATEPDPAPTWEGHTLEGWYTENTCQNKWDFTTPVTSDITLYAGWKEDEPGPGPEPTPVPPSGSSGDGNMENAYRVLFNDGATTLSVVTDLSAGDKLTKPEDPVKDGYTFAGWHKDTACTQPWDFNDGITGDMTLYAKWTPQETVTPTATATPTVTATATATATPTGNASLAPTVQPDNNGNNGDTTATSGISLSYLIGGILILLLAILLLLILLLRHTVTFLIPTGGELEEYRIKVWHGRYINTEDLPDLIRTAAWYRDTERQERWDFDQDRVKKSIELYLG